MYNTRQIKTVALLLLVLILLIGSFYWVATRSFLEITVNNAGDDEITYTITDQANDTKTVTSEKNTIKTLVRKGEQQVSVEQGGQTSFTVVKTGGFLQTTPVELELTAKASRQFVGDNPLNCMGYTGALMVSWLCGDEVGKARGHVPATESSASSARELSKALPGFSFNSLIRDKEKAYVLTSLFYHDTLGLTLFPLNQNTGEVLINQSVPLEYPADSSGAQFQMTAYRDGYLVHDDTLDNALFFDAIKDSNPENLSLPRPENSELSLYFLDVVGGSILLTYNSLPGNELLRPSYFPSSPIEHASDDSEEGTGAIDHAHYEPGTEGFSEIFIVDKAGDEKEFAFDFVASQTRLCAENLVCFMKEGVMEVYDISGDEAKKVYDVADVLQIEVVDGALLMVTNTGVVRFDPEARSGHYQYTFGGYAYCGITPVDDYYLLCVDNGTSSSRARSALRIAPNQDVDDEIDKQVLALTKMDEINVVAPYKNYIHISPELGERELNPSTGNLEYRPETIKNVNQTINEMIKQLNINRKRYTIVNPYE